MPVIARPIVPPTCWNSVRLLVPVPRSRTGTAFCTASVKTAKDGPMPRPATTIHSHRSGSGVSGRMFVIRKRPNASVSSANDDQRLVATGPRHELSGADGGDDQTADQRQDLVARLGRRAAVHELEPARQEDDRGEEAHRRQEHRDHAGGEGADAGRGEAERSARARAIRRTRRPPSTPGRSRSARRPPDRSIRRTACS